MIKRLLKIKLRGTFLSALGGKDKQGNHKSVSKGKIVGYTLIYALLAIVFLAFVSTFAAPLSMILLPLGGENMYFGIFMLLSLTVIFVFSIFETKNELYECKDNELLLAMPIRPRDIVISRIFTVLIYNYIEELIIMIPVVVCYLIFGGGITGVFGSLIVFATVPLLATALAAGVGYAVHLVSHKLARFRNFAVMVLSIGFLALYIFGYTALMESMDSVFENLENNFGSIAEKYSAISFIGSAATLNPIALPVYLAVVATVTCVAVIVISKKYMSLITSTVKTKKAVYVAKELKGKSALTSLTKKEFSKILSSPTYMLNGALGFLLQIVAAVVIVILGPKLLDADPAVLAELGMSADSLVKLSVPLFISILVFVQSTAMLSVSALSLEGKNLWILKSMPISAKTVLLAKTVPQIILSVVCSVISGLIVGIGIGASVTDAIFLVLIPAAMGVMFSFVGIIINVILPKFDFVNEVQVIKQSTACLISLVLNMIVSVGVLVISIVSMSVQYPSLVLLVLLGAVCLICTALYFVTVGPMARRYSTF